MVNNTNKPDKEILLSVADGPEHIEIYTSKEEAIVDWSSQIPSLYISASVNGAYVKLGPFQLDTIISGVKAALNKSL